MSNIQAQIICANSTKKTGQTQTILELSKKIMIKNNAKILFKWELFKRNSKGTL